MLRQAQTLRKGYLREEYHQGAAPGRPLHTRIFQSMEALKHIAHCLLATSHGLPGPGLH